MNDKTDNIKKMKSRTWFKRLTSILTREPKDREQLTAVLRDAKQRDVLTGEVLGMIERILQVSEMQVREVMVPKAQMVMVELDQHLKDLLPMVIESGHSRFPVVEPNKKEIVGILLAKDLLSYYFHDKKSQFNMLNILRPALFVPQSKRLDILLREFRINRNHLAIVLDEYGHIEGLVTIEDVLEQIVGEIEDEYDIDEADSLIKKLNDGTYIIKASIPIDEFNAYFNSNFADEEFDTIGGIVLQGFGYLPKRGESVKLDGFRFKVLNGDSRRIYLLEVKMAKTKGISKK